MIIFYKKKSHLIYERPTIVFSYGAFHWWYHRVVWEGQVTPAVPDSILVEWIGTAEVVQMSEGGPINAEFVGKQEESEDKTILSHYIYYCCRLRMCPMTLVVISVSDIQMNMYQILVALSTKILNCTGCLSITNLLLYRECHVAQIGVRWHIHFISAWQVRNK